MKEIRTVSDFVSAINKNTNLTIIDFYANWCGPCKIISPKFAKMEKKYSNVNFYKLNCDNDQVAKVIEACEISYLPTFCVFRNGECITKIVSSDDKQVETLLQKLLAIKE